MQIDKSDWQWLITIIATIAAPLIGDWLKEKGLFHRRNQGK